MPPYPYRNQNPRAQHGYTHISISSRRVEVRTVFIGDRAAQFCALVRGAPLIYTGDRLTTFDVQKLVERYVEHLAERPDRLVETRKIVLSTGLAWSPKYDGMIGKQLKTLLAESFLTPRIYVLGVSSRLLTSSDMNIRIERQCNAGIMRRQNALFLGGFDASAAYPQQPTAAEALEITGKVFADPII